MRVAITGANGFIGSGIAKPMAQAGLKLIGLVRNYPGDTAQGFVETRVIEDPWSVTAWETGLARTDAVIHLIGAAHYQQDGSSVGSPASLTRTNVDVTAALLEACRTCAIRRFVYISSVKAVAEVSRREPISANTGPSPGSTYGRSKLQAENAIVEWAHRTRASAVILRPPLVYGDRVKGNMRQLLRVADTPLPLPLGAIANARSLISIHNLAAALIAALNVERPVVARLPLADPQPISTTELIRQLRHLLNRPTRLVPIPRSWLYAVARPFGMAERVSKLTENLVISNLDAEAALGWRPKQSTEEGLAAMVESYLATDGWTQPQA